MVIKIFINSIDRLSIEEIGGSCLSKIIGKQKIFIIQHFCFTCFDIEQIIFIDNKMSNVENAQKAGMLGIYFDDAKRDYDKLFEEMNELLK